MTVNFPTSFDDKTSLYGDMDDLVILTLNGAVTQAATSLTFNETGKVDGLDTYTCLSFKDKGCSDTVFTGSGLNDLTRSGTYVGNGKKRSYRCQIDATGSPDTFKWSNDGGSTWKATGVSCSTSPISLEEGLSVSFGATTGHTLDDRWDWNSGFEVVRITAKGGAGTGVVTVTRGLNGTTQMPHASAAQAAQDPTARDIALLREALVAAQKYTGLVGVDASKPGSCAPGQVYIATDTSKVYVCFATDTWTLAFLTDHGQFAGLGDDDHTQYHNDTRAGTWHSGLSASHLTSGSTHNHNGTGTNGDPVRKWATGLDSAKGTPTAVGQVYYAYDAHSLYFSTNGSSWTKYVTTPKGTIMFFASSCPAGWTQLSALDHKFVKGANTGVWTGLTSGGGSHTHTVPDLISHVHTISAQTGISLPAAGSHTHTHPSSNSTGTNDRPYSVGLAVPGSLASDQDGAHTHTVTVDAHVTNSTGTASPSTDGGTLVPAYYSLRACQKD